MTFLVYTRDKNCWPKNGSKLLMGPWCLSHDDDSYEMLPSPWFNRDDLLRVNQELNDIYEELLLDLSDVLNIIHGVSNSHRFWRIVVGPYLYWFINVCYDRYTRLVSALSLYKDIKIPCYKKSSFVDIKDTYDFVLRAKNDDLYNLQLISRMTQIMGIKPYLMVSKKNSYSSTLEQKYENATISKSFDYKDIYYFLKEKITKNSKVVFYKAGFDEKSVAQLLFLSAGKISSIDENEELSEFSIERDEERRDFLRKSLKKASKHSENPYSEMLRDILCDEFPIIFLEGFSELQKVTRKKFKNLCPKIICSAIGWFFDEKFKCWSAKLADQNAQLIGIQHGGNYGIIKPLFAEEHELKISDFYFTWGWSDSKSTKCIPINPPKLMIKNQISSDRMAEESVLYLSTSPCRYLIEFPWIPEYSLTYMEQQNVFFQNTDQDFLKNIYFRPYMHDYVWEIEKKIKTLHPNLKILNKNISFKDSLLKSKIFVCDHLSTTFVEALSIKKPTILFWDPEINAIRDSAIPFIDALREVKILHDSAKEAALWMQHVYYNIDDWWNSPECQNAVSDFCLHYANTSKYPIRDWLVAVKKMYGSKYG